MGLLRSVMQVQSHSTAHICASPQQGFQFNLTATSKLQPLPGPLDLPEGPPSALFHPPSHLLPAQNTPCSSWIWEAQERLTMGRSDRTACKVLAQKGGGWIVPLIVLQHPLQQHCCTYIPPSANSGCVFTIQLAYSQFPRKLWVFPPSIFSLLFLFHIQMLFP